VDIPSLTTSAATHFINRYTLFDYWGLSVGTNLEVFSVFFAPFLVFWIRRVTGT